MRCLFPRTVGFHGDGKTIAWSQKSYSREFPTFKLPCGKCTECRLEYARQWAIRCVHEAKCHVDNCFITLTYSDENLSSPRLDYADFQAFMKRLRDRVFRDLLERLFPDVEQSTQRKLFRQLPKESRKEWLDSVAIGVFVTGEYGDTTKRPHWHAILFNYEPPDLKYQRTNDNGDKIYTSKILDQIWGKNDPEKKPSEVGSVTFKSAGYVARYASKKLVHGKDQDHDFHPISRKSSKRAIGKRWLEKYWQDAFRYGRIILEDGTEASIPRYYEKWLEKNKPEEFKRYVTGIKAARIAEFSAKGEKEKEEEENTQRERFQKGQAYGITRADTKRILAEEKLKRLIFIKDF